MTKSDFEILDEQAVTLCDAFRQAGYTEAADALNSIMCLHTSGEDAAFWLDMAFGVLQPLVDAAEPYICKNCQDSTAESATIQ